MGETRLERMADRAAVVGSPRASFAWEACCSGRCGGRAIVLGAPFLGVFSLSVHRTDDTPAHKRSWLWNGNEDAPSLSPSIDTTPFGGAWHGHITDGSMTNA